MYVIICYDVQDDKTRERIAEILLDYGVRIQKSVFECELKPEQLPVLKRRLSEAMDVEEDSLCFYHLCETCRLRAERFGASKQRYEESQRWII